MATDKPKPGGRAGTRATTAAGTSAKSTGKSGARPVRGGAQGAARPTKAGEARAAVVELVAVADRPSGVAVQASTVPAKGATLRKKELLERVVAASGAKKKDARDIVEAVLKVLGEALHKGEALALPPFGKAKVNRQKDTAGGETLVVKLRRGNGAKPAKEVLAEAEE